MDSQFLNWRQKNSYKLTMAKIKRHFSKQKFGYLRPKKDEYTNKRL